MTVLEKAITLYKKGVKIQTIMEMTGISATSLYKHIKRQGIAIRKPSGVRIELLAQRNVVADYLSGKYSIKEICERHGIRAHMTIYGILKRNKIAVRHFYWTNPLVQLNVVEDYLSGKYSIKEIRERHSMRSAAMLYKILAQHGVKPKNKHNG